MRGKTVRCKKCANTFTVQEAAPEQEAEDLAPATRKADPDAIQEKSRPVRDQQAAVRASPRRPVHSDYSDDDDDFDDAGRRPAKKGWSPALVIGLVLGLVVGVVGLCCGVPIGIFLWAKHKAEEKIAEVKDQLENTAITPFGFTREPKDLAEALEALRGNDNARKHAAAGWLSRQRLDASRQTEVAKALDTLLTSPQKELHRPALDALKVWGTTDNVPSLIVELQDETSGDRGVAIEVAGKIKDPRPVPLVAKWLPNFFEGDKARDALQAMGPAAQGEVVKYLFHPDGGARDRAAFLLRSYNTQPGVVLSQVIVEFKGPDNNRRRLALEWLEKAVPEQARQAEVARALDPLLIDGDNGVQGTAMRAAVVWATRDNVPTLLRVLANTAFNPHSNEMRKQSMQILAKLKDERGIAPIAARLTDIHDRGGASMALKAMGPMAAQEVRKYLDHKDPGVRNEAKAILDSYGTKENAGLTKALGDLLAPNADRQKEGADAIAKMPVDVKRQKEVSLALDGLLGNNNNAVRQAALKALMVWATKESVSPLIKVLGNKDDAASRHLALSVLGKLKDKDSVLAVATRLLDDDDRPHASNALVAMGSMCEEVVATALRNAIPAVRLEACKILEKVGTKKSVEALKNAEKAYLKLKDDKLAAAAKSAAAAAGKR
jgi:HEAT repeat protein